jgi:hypothetical protein
MLLAAAQPPGMTDEAWDVLRERIESAPQAVATFIERRTTCNEIRRDPRRGPALAARLRIQFRCASLSTDGQALYRAYHSRPQIIQLLKETEKLRPW